MKSILIGLILIFSNQLIFSEKGYEIKVKIVGVRDTNIILGHHFANSMYPDDTVRCDKNGVGIFKGKKELPQGMYIIFFLPKIILILLLGKIKNSALKMTQVIYLKK